MRVSSRVCRQAMRVREVVRTVRVRQDAQAHVERACADAHAYSGLQARQTQRLRRMGCASDDSLRSLPLSSLDRTRLLQRSTYIDDSKQRCVALSRARYVLGGLHLAGNAQEYIVDTRLSKCRYEGARAPTLPSSGGPPDDIK